MIMIIIITPFSAILTDRKHLLNMIIMGGRLKPIQFWCFPNNSIVVIDIPLIPWTLKHWTLIDLELAI